MATGVAAAAQLVPALPPTKSAFRRQRSHWVWVSSPPLPFQRFRYPPISVSASVNPPLPPPLRATISSPIKLYVSGLSFRTTEESLRNAFEQFGQLTEVNLVMDKIANRPRGFAFLCYSTEEQARKAIAGMHGKFLHGRVIFVEVAKPRSQISNTTQKL